MTDWLKNRLTPVKRGSERWTEFASAIEQYWEENFDPELQRLADSRSIYTTDEEGLKRRLEAWGDFFRDAGLFEEDKPLAVAWRKMELAFKDQSYILELALKRKFPNLEVSWFPLLHRKADPYGKEFISEYLLNALGPWNPDDYFLTSHGAVFATLEALTEAGVTLAEFVTHAYGQLGRIKPLHIVFRGVQTYTTAPFNIYMDTLTRGGAYVTIGTESIVISIAPMPFRHSVIMRSGAFIEIGIYPEGD